MQGVLSSRVIPCRNGTVTRNNSPAKFHRSTVQEERRYPPLVAMPFVWVTPTAPQSAKVVLEVEKFFRILSYRLHTFMPCPFPGTLQSGSAITLIERCPKRHEPLAGIDKCGRSQRSGKMIAPKKIGRMRGIPVLRSGSFACHRFSV